MLKRLLPRSAAIAAACMVFVVYPLARIEDTSASEKRVLASRFDFQKYTISSASLGLRDQDRKGVRKVHRDYDLIDAWISSVGAAVSISDVDHDGFHDDLVLVTPSFDKVIVTSAPAGILAAPKKLDALFEPFALNSKLIDEDKCAPMGSICQDFNEDGAVDILVWYWGRSPLIFFQSPGKTGALSRSHFEERELVTTRPRWFTNAAISCDIDGDGHLDILVANYFADGSAVLDAASTQPQKMQASMSRAFNGGGKHFFLWSSKAQAFVTVIPKDENGDSYGGRVVDEPSTSNIFTGWTLAVGACDLNHDSLPEIYIANDFGPDRLLENLSKPGEVRLRNLQGRKDFLTPNSRVLGNDSFKGMGVDFWDLNTDGTPDIFVSNIATEFALEESHFAFISQPGKTLMREGQVTYVDRGEELNVARGGWGWDVKLGDFDNDSDPELVRAVNFIKGSTNRWPELHEKAMGNDAILKFARHWPHIRPGADISGHDRMPFYVRDSRGRFINIAHEIGVDSDSVGRGVATSDVDADGKLDFVVANQWEDSSFFHNTSATKNAYFSLQVVFPVCSKGGQLELVKGISDEPARAAVGAEVVVTLADGRKYTQQVDGGNGHSGKRSTELHFGLGARAEPFTIQAFWRSHGVRQSTDAIACRPGRYCLKLPAQKETGIE